MQEKSKRVAAEVRSLLSRWRSPKFFVPQEDDTSSRAISHQFRQVFFFKYSIYWHTVFIWRLILAHSRPSQGKSLEDKEEQVEGLLHRERALAIGIQLLSHNASGHITEHLNIIIKNGTGDFFDAPCRGWRSNIAQRSSASVSNGTSRPLKPFFFLSNLNGEK